MVGSSWLQYSVQVSLLDEKTLSQAQQLLELANVGGNFASAVGIPDRQPQAVGAAWLLAPTLTSDCDGGGEARQ